MNKKINKTHINSQHITLQIGLIILNFLLFVAAIYDLIFSRRMGGDPTISHRDPSGIEATTFNNPAFKEKKSMNPSEYLIQHAIPYTICRSAHSVCVCSQRPEIWNSIYYSNVFKKIVYRKTIVHRRNIYILRLLLGNT